MILLNILSMLVIIIISYCVGYINGSKPIKVDNDNIHKDLKKYNK